MRTLLVCYMTKQLMISQERASLVYGLYTTFLGDLVWSQAGLTVWIGWKIA